MYIGAIYLLNNFHILSLSLKTLILAKGFIALIIGEIGRIIIHSLIGRIIINSQWKIPIDIIKYSKYPLRIRTQPKRIRTYP